MGLLVSPSQPARRQLSALLPSFPSRLSPVQPSLFPRDPRALEPIAPGVFLPARESLQALGSCRPADLSTSEADISGGRSGLRDRTSCKPYPQHGDSQTPSTAQDI